MKRVIYVIIRENIYDVHDVDLNITLNVDGDVKGYEKALFFDLEHYVYKKPICIGVFGCCYYDKEKDALIVTQYMIENKKEIKDLLYMAKDYFSKMYRELNKKYIVTFSGNNDFHVIKYLFDKYGIKFDFSEYFKDIDLQRYYEKESKKNIGLKALEKKMGIVREGELISGSNLAKTFAKVIKDKDYINRMPEEKIEKILLYNEQDVVNLFHIYTTWEHLKDIEQDEILNVIEENDYISGESDKEKEA